VKHAADWRETGVLQYRTTVSPQERGASPNSKMNLAKMSRMVSDTVVNCAKRLKVGVCAPLSGGLFDKDEDIK
jgi:hypothetical protein